MQEKLDEVVRQEKDIKVELRQSNEDDDDDLFDDNEVSFHYHVLGSLLN